jgi:hypothetical protein
LFGWWTQKQPPSKPKPPSRTIWACGWSNPLPNPTYAEEMVAYQANLAAWKDSRVKNSAPTPRKVTPNPYVGVGTGPRPPRP